MNAFLPLPFISENHFRTSCVDCHWLSLSLSLSSVFTLWSIFLLFILQNIQKRKTKYFGHIKRKKNLLTTSLEGKLEGKRPRGRPRNMWMTDIKEWTGQSAYACTQKAADRTLGVSLLVNRRRGDGTPR